MNRRQRSSLMLGLLLIIVGGGLLALQFMPEWRAALGNYLGWPMIIIGVAGLLLLIGVLTGAPGMVVPTCIVGGIGGILYWQNATGNWESWAYVWTLIPGFVGLGTLLLGLLTSDSGAVRGGLGTIATSIVLFLIFASLFGGLGLLGNYWPVLLIVLGLITLGQALFRRPQSI